MTDAQILRTSPQTVTQDRIKVFLRECKTDLLVGAYEEELHKPQPVLVTLEVEAALPHRYQNLADRDLDHVIDYARYYRFIREDLPKMGFIGLLETVAEQIIAFCFQDSRIEKATVRIEKTDMFKGTARAGVEVSRVRGSNGI